MRISLESLEACSAPQRAQKVVACGVSVGSCARPYRCLMVHNGVFALFLLLLVPRILDLCACLSLSVSFSEGLASLSLNLHRLYFLTDRCLSFLPLFSLGLFVFLLHVCLSSLGLLCLCVPPGDAMGAPFLPPPFLLTLSPFWRWTSRPTNLQAKGE